MEWNQSEVLALATEKCTTCEGYGMRPTRNGRVTACNCVLRSIFRVCYDRFKASVARKRVSAGRIWNIRRRRTANCPGPAKMKNTRRIFCWWSGAR